MPLLSLPRRAIPPGAALVIAFLVFAQEGSAQG